MATQEDLANLLRNQQAQLEAQQKQLEEQQQQGQALLTELQALRGQLGETQQAAVQAEARRAAAEQQLLDERTLAAAALSPGEQKLLTKPDRFTSDPEKWKEWSKEFVSFLAAGTPLVRKVTELATSRRDGEAFSEEELALLGFTGVSALLFTVLENQTRGVAQGLVEQAKGNGVEAWRLLVKEYDPSEPQSEVDDLLPCLQPGTYSEANLHKAVLDWGKGRGDYQKKFEEAACTDRQAKAILISMTEGQLREHLRLHGSGKEKSYAKVRDTILTYLRAKGHKAEPAAQAGGTGGGGNGAPAGQTPGGVAPMDIDAATRTLLAALGKGAGKGLGGGASSSGGWREEENSAGNRRNKKKLSELQPWEATEEEKKETCEHCHNQGHTARTCFKLHPHLKEARAAAAKAKKGEKQRLAALTDTSPAQNVLVVDALTLAQEEDDSEEETDCPAFEAATREPELYDTPADHLFP